MILIKFLWQLPQTILGFIFLFINRKQINKKSRFKGTRVYHLSDYSEFGISFGEIIFISTDVRGTKLIWHEYGHTIQSRLLGWLYIFLIGIPSVIRFIWLNKKLKGIDTESKKKEIISWYYQGYPENWADQLSGFKNL
jgi:hypothetical protein